MIIHEDPLKNAFRKNGTHKLMVFWMELPHLEMDDDWEVPPVYKTSISDYIGDLATRLKKPLTSRGMTIQVHDRGISHMLLQSVAIFCPIGYWFCGSAEMGNEHVHVYLNWIFDVPFMEANPKFDNFELISMEMRTRNITQIEVAREIGGWNLWAQDLETS